MSNNTDVVKIYRYVGIERRNDDRYFGQPYSAPVFSFAINHDVSKNLLYFAASICSVKDEFSKKVGRKLADERLGHAEHTFVWYFNPTIRIVDNVGVALLAYDNFARMNKEYHDLSLHYGIDVPLTEKQKDVTRIFAKYFSESFNFCV